jgi:hypothetical protein
MIDLQGSEERLGFYLVSIKCPSGSKIGILWSQLGPFMDTNYDMPVFFCNQVITFDFGGLRSCSTGHQRSAHNPKVASSSPPSATKSIKGLEDFQNPSSPFLCLFLTDFRRN